LFSIQSNSSSVSTTRVGSPVELGSPIDIRMVDLDTPGAFEDFSDAVNDIFGLHDSLRQIELASFDSKESVYATLTTEREQHVALMHQHQAQLEENLRLLGLIECERTAAAINLQHARQEADEAEDRLCHRDKTIQDLLLQISLMSYNFKKIMDDLQ